LRGSGSANNEERESVVRCWVNDERISYSRERCWLGPGARRRVNRHTLTVLKVQTVTCHNHKLDVTYLFIFSVWWRYCSRRLRVMSFSPVSLTKTQQAAQCGGAEFAGPEKNDKKWRTKKDQRLENAFSVAPYFLFSTYRRIKLL